MPDTYPEFEEPNAGEQRFYDAAPTPFHLADSGDQVISLMAALSGAKFVKGDLVLTVTVPFEWIGDLKALMRSEGELCVWEAYRVRPG